jgi:ATP-binding cassette subfamily C (CFTR/MRP) protein 4
MRYRADLPFVLRGVSLALQAGSRVGVIGRTGAGKSSLVAALLRLVPSEASPLGVLEGDAAVAALEAGRWPEAGPAAAPRPPSTTDGGCVRIDGRDVRDVPLSQLRRAVSAIPQEPTLFAGTVRGNLDPFGENSDEQLVDALERVQLADEVGSRGGLGAPVDEDGGNFSTGQRQLLCLARAVLRRSRIVVLDEPSAHADEGTDARIQAAVRRAFPGATVITVAHRLHTVMDSDLVVVMDAGQAAEVGAPHELLQREGGALARLVGSTGPRMAAHLRSLALRAFEARGGARAA